jgi:hypothetical protein
MVDIIDVADAVFEADQVADRGDMSSTVRARHELINFGGKGILQYRGEIRLSGHTRVGDDRTKNLVRTFSLTGVLRMLNPSSSSEEKLAR